MDSTIIPMIIYKKSDGKRLNYWLRYEKSQHLNAEVKMPNNPKPPESRIQYPVSGIRYPLPIHFLQVHYSNSLLSWYTLFRFNTVTGATINGNFSTVTLLVSNPNPFSSLRLISFNQKYNFIMILSKKGNSLS